MFRLVKRMSSNRTFHDINCICSSNFLFLRATCSHISLINAVKCVRIHRYVQISSFQYCKYYSTTGWIKKVAPPLNYFAIFSFRLRIFSCNFADMLQFISTCVYQFRWFILIFSKMELIFLWVLIVFTIASFEFHQVKLPWLHHQWVAVNSPNLTSPFNEHRF